MEGAVEPKEVLLDLQGGPPSLHEFGSVFSPDNPFAASSTKNGGSAATSPPRIDPQRTAGTQSTDAKEFRSAGHGGEPKDQEAAPRASRDGAVPRGNLVVEIVPDLNRSARIMESRKSMRRWRGTSQPTRPGLTWLLFLVLLCSLLYIRDLSGYVNSADVAAIPGNYTYFVAAFGLSFETSEYYETQWWDYTIGVLIVAVFLVFVYLAINLQIYYRLTFGNYILGIALGLSITRRAAGALGKNASAQIIGPAILVIFGIYLVYLLVTIFLWNLLPKWQLAKGCFLPKFWSSRVFPIPRVMTETISEVYKACNIKTPMGQAQAGIKISYSSWMGSLWPRFCRKWTRSTYMITYTGEVDESGYPHGYGEWNDTYRHGEVLQGWWSHGVPSGPFRSVETGSGAGFVRLMIPYVRNRTDDLYSNNGKIVHAPMTCGIFEVECCVAGVFFREYPKVDTFLEVPPSGSLADDLGVLISRLLATPDLQAVSSVVLQADLMRGLLVSAHTRPLDSLDSNSVTVSVVEMDGRHLVRQPTEFKNFADMLAKTFRHRPVQDSDGDPTDEESTRDIFGELSVVDEEDAERGLPPTHFLAQPSLVVSGWAKSSFHTNCEALVFLPGFNSATFGSAKILAQLLALGNFPSYLKPFIYSWPGGGLTSFGSAQILGAESPQTSEDLKTLLLSLGSMGLHTIHIMTHSMGVRVLTAAIPALEEVFGVYNSGSQHLMAEGGEGASSKMRLSTVMMLNPEVGRHEFVDCYARRLSALCGCITMYADAQDTALFGSELMNSVMRCIWPDRRLPVVVEDLSKALPRKRKLRQARKGWEYSVGRISKDLMYADGTLVDIDIIQTTHLGANVQSTRHNAFNLNRELVDDLRDVMVNKQRAFQRNARLQYRGGNRYNFLVAPTHVVNP